MNRQTLIYYHATLWPSVCTAQKWDTKDSTRRRDTREACWEGINRADKGDSMPDDDAETTALFTYLRSLAAPDNISLDMEWEKCRCDYKAYNTALRADWWERRGFGKRGARKLQNNRFGHRRTARGLEIEEPLTQEEANQRLWKIRQATRRREAHMNRKKPTMP